MIEGINYIELLGMMLFAMIVGFVLGVLSKREG